jgi:hypothetical protein
MIIFAGDSRDHRSRIAQARASPLRLGGIVSTRAQGGLRVQVIRLGSTGPERIVYQIVR